MDHPWRRALPRLALTTLCAVAAGPAAAEPSAAGGAAAADTLAVGDCVALARRASPDVRALAPQLEAARLDSTAASRNGRPAYSVFGGATVAPNGFYDPTATNLGEYELKAGLALPLRDGGSRRRERQRASLGASGATIEAARASRDAGLRTAEVALDLLRVRETAGALRETLEWLDRLELLVASGVRAGSRDRGDATRVALERDAVRADLESLDESRATLGRELAQLLDRATGEPPELREPPPSEEAGPAPADSAALLERGERSPEVQAARIEQAQQQLSLDEARHKTAFTVDLTADAGIWGTDLTHTLPPDLLLDNPDATFADRLHRDLGASVALRFQRPVLDPAAGLTASARERDVRSATVRAETARAERRRASLDLLGRWESASRRLTLADSASVRAEEHLLRLRSLYAAGASTLLELLDARRQLDDERGRRADARLDTRLARWEEELQ